MKKIKIIGEKIVSKLVGSYKSGKATCSIEEKIPCPEKKSWLEIDCRPIYFFRNWDMRRLPSEGGAAFIFHDGCNLNVVAVMEDSDVFSDAGPSNDETWVKGDVLELFIQPGGAGRYYELHVAPNLATLQLAIPDIEGFRARKYQFEELFFDSESEFGADSITLGDFKGWWGLVCVPAKKIALDLSPESSAKFAVCRYNYWRGREKPECSSTAALSKLSFHTPEEWQTMQF